LIVAELFGGLFWPTQANQLRGHHGGRRRLQPEISASFRRRSLLRWGRTSRRGRARLSPPPLINPRVISDGPPYQKPKGGEGRGQPRPEANFVGPSGAGTARLIVTGRIGVARVRHDSVLFSIDQMSWIRNLLTARNVPVTLSRDQPRRLTLQASGCAAGAAAWLLRKKPATRGAGRWHEGRSPPGRP
jgi:hypothetical protein